VMHRPKVPLAPECGPGCAARPRPG
jgi:hypothetical protein